jgi:uncharacterized protein
MSGLRDAGAYDPRYIRFLDLFNRERDYYECHDVMEDLWLEEGRKPLLQGLLQVAVGLYHLDNGNRPGAVKLLTAALEKLACYPETALGIDLERLRRDASYCCQQLKQSAASPCCCSIAIRIVDERLGRLLNGEGPPQPQKE